MIAADVVVEARGVLCPVPIIRLARAASANPPGTVVELITDDPAAEHDVPAWCRLRGHALLVSEPLIAGGAGPEHAGAASGGRSDERSDVEPHAPNPAPDQAVRHLIRLAGPASPSTGATG